MIVGRYDADIKGAQKQIKADGQLVTWRKPNKSTSNTQPWKSTGIAQNPTDFPVSMVFLRVTSKSIERFMNATDVTIGAPYALMAGGLAFVPEMTDIIIRDGVQLVVESIDILAPNGTPILYYVIFE